MGVLTRYDSRSTQGLGLEFVRVSNEVGRRGREARGAAACSSGWACKRRCLSTYASRKVYVCVRAWV